MNKTTISRSIGRTLSSSLDSLFFSASRNTNSGYLASALRALGAGRDPHASNDSANTELARLLSSTWSYHRVKADVWRQGKTARLRAAAFVSTALAYVGVHVPRDLVIDGLSAYSITWGLSRYLEEQRGWHRVSRIRDLVEGDIVFTEDAPCCPGIPHHVFVFMGWHDRARGLAYVTDNHGSSTISSMYGAGSSSRRRPVAANDSVLHATAHVAPTDSPAAYALRAPTSTVRLLRASA